MSNAFEAHGEQAASRSAGKPKEPPPVASSDLPGLQAAINQASSSAASLWLSFLTFMAYLTMTVGAVTHETLLRQKPIELPVLNVNLPLVGFFWIAPLFFLLFHFYLFLQLSILVRKVAGFDDELKRAVPTESAREDYRKRLDPFLIVQFLAGSQEERNGITGRLLRLVALISLVILPIALLIQFQLTFLPYHEPRVTWVHRIAILIDLRLVWVFWFAIRSGSNKIDVPELEFLLRDGRSRPKFKEIIGRGTAALKHAWRQRRSGVVAATVVVFFCLFVFAFKGEPIAKLVQIPFPRIDNNSLVVEMEPISDAALHGRIDMVDGRPKSWFSNVLVVPNRKLTDGNIDSGDLPSLSLRGRNLSGAVLIGSDLRGIDFTGANLNGAHLERALLTRAKFGCGSTFDARTKKYGWPEDECTWLQLASFAEAKLQAADFERARMQGAILIGANLTGAQLRGTQLQEAMLVNAQLQAASIVGANLSHAFLSGANLIGAKISNSDLEDILIGDTMFQLTYVEYGNRKVRLSSNHRVQSSDVAEAAGADANLPVQFMYAEFQNVNITLVEDINQVIDKASLAKTRQIAIAQLAAQNKMAYTDFDDLYDKADEVDWGTIDTLRKKASFELPSIKQYAIDFACDPGSSPYIMDGLIQDEKIMWVLQKILTPDPKTPQPKEPAVQQAIDVLTEMASPASCAGALDISKTDTVAIGYMKQKIASIGKAAPKKPEGEPAAAGSAVPAAPKPSTTKGGPAH